MIGYVFGTIIGILVYIYQNFKPTSGWFRICYLLFSIAFLIGMYFAGMGYWNILVIPLGELILAFVAAFIFPCAMYAPDVVPKGFMDSKQSRPAIKYMNEYFDAFSLTLENMPNSSFIDESVFYSLIRSAIEKNVGKNQEEFCKAYDNDPKAEKQCILFLINNISGNYLESGSFHLNRGILDDRGESLMRIFCLSSSEIVNLHVKDSNGNLIDDAWARRNLDALKVNIATVG